MKKLFSFVLTLVYVTAFAQNKESDKPKTTYTNTAFHEAYQPKYDRSKWKSTPKNVILLIGDGTGLTQLYSAYSANKGKLTVFNINDIGLSITASADDYITDSAAGATAMSSGTKTNNAFVGVGPDKKSLPLITDPMRSKKYRLAIISNGDITDATPASFYAHQPNRKMSEEIALDFMSSPTDILIGGGTKSFNARKDNRNLLDELGKLGYSTATSFENLDALKTEKLIVLDDKAVVSKIDGRKDFLERSLKKSLDIFSTSKQPFFIMEEGAQIDWGGHQNNIEYVITEALDFDKTIGQALRFADANNETLIVITADHETGGLSLIDGDMSKGYVEAAFGTGHHTAVAVPVFAYGPGADKFRGVYQNTEIYRKLKELLGL